MSIEDRRGSYIREELQLFDWHSLLKHPEAFEGVVLSVKEWVALLEDILWEQQPSPVSLSPLKSFILCGPTLLTRMTRDEVRKLPFTYLGFYLQPGESFRGLQPNSQFLWKDVFDRVDLPDCSFEGVDLTYQSFEESTLDRTTFEGCRIREAHFLESSLNSTNFAKTNLVGTAFGECSITSSSFLKAFLVQTKFRNCDLRGTNFSNATIEWTVFERSKLEGAKGFKGRTFKATDFSFSILSGLDLRGCIFDKIPKQTGYLGHTRLRDTDFREADLRGAQFTSGVLWGETDFRGADLRGAKFDYETALLDQMLFKGAIVDENTEGLGSDYGKSLGTIFKGERPKAEDAESSFFDPFKRLLKR